MKLQVFNGGENSRVRPQYIGITEGAVYHNINSEINSLSPVMMPKATNISSQRYQHWFIAGNRWLDSAVRRDYVEFEEIMYWTDRTTRPQKMSKTGVQNNLGVTPPPKITSATIASRPEAINDVSIEPQRKNTGLPMQTQYYLLINQDASGYSAAFHFFVDTYDRVTTIAQGTTDPQIRQKINTSDEDTSDKRRVKVSKIEGVTAGSVGFKLFRQYKDKFYLVGTFTDEIIDQTEDISGNEELDKSLFGPLKGVYTYTITYYNNTDGSESASAPVSDEFDVSDGGTITLNSLTPSTDPQITHKRIYRVGGAQATFALVVQIPNNQTTFLDNIRDDDIVGTLLESENAYPAPTGLAFLQQAYAMLFGALGTRLRFTPVGKPNDWPESYYLQFDAPITGIAPVANGVLVFTYYRTYIVTGTGPESLSQYPLSSDQGCIDFSSVQLIGTEAVWASTDGICSSSGNRPQVISWDKLGKIKLSPIDSVIYDEAYYLMEADGSILCWNKGIIERFNFNVFSLALANDNIYGWRDGQLYELFTGSVPATFKFKTARLTEGLVTANKTYKNVFLYSRGHVIINILINDVLVQTKELNGEDSFQIPVPQTLQRGFFIQFELEGEGEVYELNYEIGQQ